MITLKTIIQSTAARMPDVQVAMRSDFGWVAIHDLTGQHEDIFLQGDDGSAFISELEFLWMTVDLARVTIALYLAEPYIQLWE